LAQHIAILVHMKITRFILAATLLVVLGNSASADIWRWIDAKGDTHFVDTMRPIYTWQDESGRVFFADKPNHVNAVSVELIWHSTGILDEAKEQESKSGSNELQPGETEAEREERLQAEAYYCKRATEIYDSYLNAPRLYKTGDDGNPAYLSDEEATKTIAATKAKVDELCH
jgi:hypothetical protein